MQMLDKTCLRKLNVLFQIKQGIVFSSYISPKAEIGRNVKFAHAYGVIIGKAKIGDGTVIFQQVTIGSHGNSLVEKAWPTIGANCRIYAGAKVIGNVKIGSNCTIGANCVVQRDIPDNAIVSVTPIKIIGFKDESEDVGKSTVTS